MTFEIAFEAFAEANKPVNGTIFLDGAPVHTYTDLTWTGSDFTLTYTQTTTAGSHLLRGDFTWPGKTDENGEVEKTVECPTPSSIAIAVDKTAVESTAVAGTTVHFTVAVTNTGNTVYVEYSFTDPKCTTLARTGANAGDTAFDPGDVWTYACAMSTQVGQTVAANTATATGKNAQGQSATATDSASIPLTQPAGGSLPETIVSGRARLRGPSGCVRRAFRARVTGRSIASVKFFVDGKLVKTIRGERSVYSFKVKPSRFGLGRHRVVARVTFLSGSNTASRRLRLTFRRCAKQTVSPRFTG